MGCKGVFTTRTCFHDGFFYDRITSYTGILQIANLTQDDTGEYVCQTSPRPGHHLDTTLEHTVTLTVNTGMTILSLLDKFKVTSEHVLIIGHCPLM